MNSFNQLLTFLIRIFFEIGNISHSLYVNYLRESLNVIKDLLDEMVLKEIAPAFPNPQYFDNIC